MSHDQDIEFMKRRCDDLDVDWYVTWKLYNEWNPLLTHAHDTMGDEFDKEFVENWDLHMLKEMNSERLLLILDKIKKFTPEFTPAERSAISLHTEHFALAEGLLSSHLGFVIWTMINNGYEFRIGNSVYDTYEKISERTLGQKLRYLRDTGVITIVTDFVDAFSRNNVGHLSYEIKSSGEIYFDGELVDYESIYNKLRHVKGALTIVMQCYYTRYNLEQMRMLYNERMKRYSS